MEEEEILSSNSIKHYYVSIEEKTYAFLKKIKAEVGCFESLNIAMETILLWGHRIYLERNGDEYIRFLQERYCESFLTLDSLQVVAPQSRAHFVFRYTATMFTEYLKDEYPLLFPTYAEVMRLNLLAAKTIYETSKDYFCIRLEEIYRSNYVELHS